MDGRKGNILLAGLAVLLALNLWQGVRLKDLAEEITGLRQYTQTVQQQIRDLESGTRRTIEDALDRADSQISSYEVEMAGLDPEARSALVEVTLWPKEYRADMAVTLLVGG